MLKKNMDLLGRKVPFKLLVLLPFAPVAAFLAVLIVWSGYESQRSEVGRIAEKDRRMTEQSFTPWLMDRAQALKRETERAAHIPVLSEALQGRARLVLRRAATPLFTDLEKTLGATHLSFHLPDRTNFIRLHAPDSSGDYVDHAGLREAEKTGKFSAALDWGDPENLSLRVVRPLYTARRLAGYMEIGQEVGTLLSDAREKFGAEALLAVRKPSSDRISPMERMPGSLQTEWSSWGELVIMHGKTERNSAVRALLRPKKPPIGWRWFRGLVHGEKQRLSSDRLPTSTSENWLLYRGRHYSKAVQSVAVADNAVLGDLILMRDVTETVEAIDRKINLLLLLMVAVMSLISSIAYRLLGRFEQDQAVFKERLMDEAAHRELSHVTRIRQLESERERLRNAQRLSKVGSWEWDSAIKSISFTNESYELFDLEPERFDQTVMGLLELVHPDDKPTISRQVKKLAVKPNAWESEFRIMTPSHGERFVRFRSEPILDAYGRLQRIRGTVQDITDRKAGSGSLLGHDNRNEWLSHVIHDAVIVLDDQARVVHWNPAAANILGYPAEEALGQEIYHFFQRVDWNEVFQRGFSVSQNGVDRSSGSQTLDVIAIGKDGIEFPVEFSLSGAELSGKCYAVGLLRDMRDKKHSEEKSRRISRALGAIHTAGIFHGRSGDLQTLLKDACGVMVDLAGYRFAGVGIIPPEGAHGVKPIAHAGRESEALHVLTRLCEASRQENSPVTDAMRTGRSLIIPVAEDNSDDDTPWIKEADKCRFTEIIVLPLMKGAQRFGVLVLCSTAVGGFSRAEAGMLEELAGVLSFGIAALYGNLHGTTANRG